MPTVQPRRVPYRARTAAAKRPTTGIIWTPAALVTVTSAEVVGVPVAASEAAPVAGPSQCPVHVLADVRERAIEEHTVVAMGLAADRLGGRGGQRLGSSSGVVVLLGGSSSDVSSGTGTLAVP